MSDRVAHPLDLVHQPLDFVEHAVHDAHQPVDIVLLGVLGQAAAEIAGHDFLDRSGDGIQPPHSSDSNDRRTDQAGQQHQDASRQQHMQQFFVEVVELANVLTQQGGASIRNLCSDAACRHISLRQCQADRKRPVEVRQRRPVTGKASCDVFALRVEQSKRTLMTRVELALMVDACNQLRWACAHEYGVFALQPVVDTLHFEARDLDVEIGEQHQRDDTEHREKQRREPETGGTVQITQAHGACIPNRERYGSSASTPRDRASFAGG
ncbi:hypothetical protein LMG28138_05847 [Pararobbsia alpina]|uniref:Uncharacterized protein n=1 Tax=Pararobbsia alpina TaxID=621374 RepID=A0A6S7C1R5_9BURK|nr:hypothetical protein LMG28138_05847 [Pararobbsia alpina]